MLQRTRPSRHGCNPSARWDGLLSWVFLMSSRINTFSALFVAVFALAGCASTVDLAKNESSNCEVHRCPMTVQVVDCSPGGFSGYRPEYNTARRSLFPHHGRIHFSEDHGYIYARQLRACVCPDCTKAHDQWQAEHPNK
jgi:hypothetical protein